MKNLFRISFSLSVGILFLNPSLAKANLAPVVSVSGDTQIALPEQSALAAKAKDDGHPYVPGKMSYQWKFLSGPGLSTATFSSPQSLTTAAKFTVPGTYYVRFSATDGLLTTNATLKIVVAAMPPFAPTPVLLPKAKVSAVAPLSVGNKIVVRAGDDLQAALDLAKPGDTVELQAGATFIAPTLGFQLRAKGGTSWITIQSSAMAYLPAGKRVNPSLSKYMARIVQPGPDFAINLEQGASYYRIQGLDVTSSNNTGGPVSLGMSYGLISLGLISEPNPAKLPHHIVLDRMYIHGNRNLHCKWGVNLNSSHAAVTNSYLSELHTVGQDGQAITSTASAGPILIHNNRLEAGTENVMFGGAPIPSALVIPSDITITKNYFYTPATWNPMSPSFIPVGNPAARWLKKNLLEFKAAKRVLVEGNIFDGSWQDGQTGFAIVIKSSNQTVPSTYTVTEHVTIRNNLFKNVASAFQISGPSAGAVLKTNHLMIYNNLGYDMNRAPYIGDSRTILWLGGTDNVTLKNNTFVAPVGNQSAVTAMPGRTNSSFTDNILFHGQYGFTCTGYGYGSAPLAICLNNLGPIRNNGLIGSKPFGVYNSEVSWANTITDAFVDPANKDFRVKASSSFAGQGMGANVTQVLQAVLGVQ